MRYLSVPAWRDAKPIYLAELVLALGWFAVDVSWECRDIEVGLGSGESPLERAAASGRRLGSLELLHLATPDEQVVNGEVVGHKGVGENSDVVVLIRAVDSTTWDIGLVDDSLFQQMSSYFPEGREENADLFDDP